MPIWAAAQQRPPDVDALAEEAFRLLNEARVEAGLSRLRFDPHLSLLAYRHSGEQANRGRVSHHSSEFGLSSERRVRISYPLIPRLAENVARNRTVERLHAGLMASEGHRRNRLDPEFTDVGVGIAWDGGYALYITEIFVTSADGGPLPAPAVYYFNAEPGAYERRDNPRVEQGAQTITIGPPGPDDPEHWTDRGITAYRDGRVQEAEAAFRKALEIQPDYHYASYNLARVLIGSERPAEGAALLDSLIALDGADVDAIATRGSAALLMQQYEDAAGYFRRVLEARPRDATAWYNLGLALEYQDRPRDAEVAYRSALDIEPGLRAAQAGLGRVLRR